jgi:hypothetical protein
MAKKGKHQRNEEEGGIGKNIVEKEEGTQPIEVVVPEPIPQGPTVDELINATLLELPNITLYQGSLAKVMTVLATYVGNPEIPVLKVDREIALSELDLTHGWSASDIELACDDIMNALGDTFGEIQSEFADKTGTESAGADFNAFAKRFKAEREEQSKLAGSARQLLQAVRAVSGELGIPNPDPGAQPLEAEKPKKFLKKIGDAVVSTGKKALSPVIEFASDVEELAEPPSWLTDPVIEQEDRDLKILELVQSRLGSQADVQLVWVTLERLNLDRETLTGVLERVAIKARDQLKQSKEILSSVSSEFKGFELRLESIQDLRQIVIAVHDFFFPPEAK